MSQPGGSQPPAGLPGTILQLEVDAVRTRWVRDRRDIGIGLYNPSTGAVHVGTYDTTGRMGHDGLQKSLGIADPDRPKWRGFIFTADGQVVNNSGFNLPDGTPPRMLGNYFAQVQDALTRAGLIY